MHTFGEIYLLLLGIVTSFNAAYLVRLFWSGE